MRVFPNCNNVNGGIWWCLLWNSSRTNIFGVLPPRRFGEWNNFSYFPTIQEWRKKITFSYLSLISQNIYNFCVSSSRTLKHNTKKKKFCRLLWKDNPLYWEVYYVKILQVISNQMDNLNWRKSRNLFMEKSKTKNISLNFCLFVCFHFKNFQFSLQSLKLKSL